MLTKTGLFLFTLTVLQVSARYKNVVPEFTKDENKLESEELSSSSRIVSGWEAQPGQLPHHASIRMVSPAGTVGQCGGAIVSRRWVLTAAQCTAGRVNLIVRVGVVSISDNNPENIFETSEWYNFPTFDDSRPTHVQPNDITLVRLQRLVVYSRLVQPIRVQSSADAYRDYDGEQVYISGHGRTSTSVPVSDVLRWVYLRAISNTDCAKSFASGTVLNTIVCAKFFNVTSQSACQGDFGGPLVHVGSDGVPTLIGLFVFTTSEDNTCPRGLPTGYTRPGPYLPWFQQITGLNFENLQEEDDEVEDTTTPFPSTTTPATSTTTPSTATTSTTTPSTAATSTNTPSTATTSTTTPSTAATSTTTPSTAATSTTTPSTAATSTTTPSTAATSTTIPSTATTSATTHSTATTSTTTPSTASTSTTTPSTFTTTSSTSTTTTTTEFTPDENTTVPPNDSEEQEPDDVNPEDNTTAPPEDSEEQEPDDVNPEDNTTAPPEDSEEQEPDDVNPEDNTTAPPEDSEEEEPGDVNPEDNTTAPPEDSEEQEPDDVNPEDNTTAPPEDSEEQEPGDVNPEDNTTAPPEDSEEQEPGDVNPEDNTTAPPEDSEEQEPGDVNPEDNTTAPPEDSEEQEPGDINPEDNTTAPPEDSEEQEPGDVNPEDNTTAPPEDSEDKEDEEGDSDSSECDENDYMGQLLKRLQVDVRVKVRLDKYNVTNVVGNEISAKH